MSATVSPPGQAAAARWWGWGREDGRPRLPEQAGRRLAEALGVTEAPTPPVTDLDQVRLPDPSLADSALERLRGVVGANHVLTDREARVRHAAGKSYPDLVRLRAGQASSAPDAVVLPGSHEEVLEALRTCSAERVAVVPFGGGTSVVGGVEPVREGFAGAVSVDLSRMGRLVDVDERSLLARLEPGLTGREAEAALAERGLTLGHFPQSFEHATIGGFVATRSAGQASTGYGRIDELVRGLRLAAPAGELTVPAIPASAAGPALRELVVGSEGTLGVITEASLAVRPAPAARRYEGWSFRSFAQGLEAFRTMEQAHAAADVARLSDEAETALAMGAAAGGGGRARRLGAAYLRRRSHEGGCLAILCFEGAEGETRDRRRRARRMLRAAGGVALGDSPGRAWMRSRYDGPYLRDDLLDLGVMVETLETATTWSRLEDLHRAVGDALRDSLSERGTPTLVACHVSHLYPSGASLYFTFMARQERGAEIDQWEAAKRAASEAIVAHGATITHHHAIGRDHRPWMRAEVGELGIEALRAVKSRLDPEGVMNPGKLLP